MGVNKNGIITTPSIEVVDVYDNKFLNGNVDYCDPIFTRTVKDGYTNFKASAAKPTANTWSWITCNNFTFEVGVTYMWRIWVRVNSANGNLYLRGARLNNDYYSGTKSVGICSSTVADGKWREYTIIQTVPAKVNNGTSDLTCSPRFEIITDNRASISANPLIIDIDIKNIQVIKTNTYLPVSDLYTDDVNLKTRFGKQFISAKDFYEV